MKETIIQDSIEFKCDEKSLMKINGRNVFLIEEHVKINEKGDRGLLSLTVPAENLKAKTIKLTITAVDTHH